MDTALISEMPVEKQTELKLRQTRQICCSLLNREYKTKDTVYGDRTGFFQYAIPVKLSVLKTKNMQNVNYQTKSENKSEKHLIYVKTTDNFTLKISSYVFMNLQFCTNIYEMETCGKQNYFLVQWHSIQNRLHCKSNYLLLSLK